MSSKFYFCNFLLGNILPLFPKPDANALNNISHKISAIKVSFETDTAEQDILYELSGMFSAERSS